MSEHCAERFVQDEDSVRKRYRNEQEFLSHTLYEQGKLADWPKGWCRSFKYHGIPPSPWITDPRLE